VRRPRSPRAEASPNLSGRREVFLEQVRSADGRSPLYDRIWRELAEEPFVDELVERYSWDTPLRIAGALHYLVLAGDASWDEPVVGALRRHGDFVRRFASEQGVQTNEVQRCWMLLPCFLELVRRSGLDQVDLVELGPSAGLNLLWDRYGYRYDAGGWGRGDALLELHGEERCPVPAELLAAQPMVRSRVGIDVAPIDVCSDDGARLLKAFVWPDQEWRLRQLEDAIEVVRREPPQLVRGDLVDELPRVLSHARGDALTLVWHTAVLGYLPQERRELVYETLEEAGTRVPLAFVQTTQPDGAVDNAGTYYGLAIRLYPGGRELVAHADFHGAWIDWRAG
jgi:hypothetical protein